MTEPAIYTKGPGNTDLGDTLVVNGSIDVRKTHPNLYRLVMLMATVCILLGLNFLFLHPTFLIYDQSNYLWGVIFLTLGAGKIVFLNFHRRLRCVRLLMASAVTYYMLIGFGTVQPFIEGTGSLQLPILYFTMALIQLPMLLEPFINPWTAERRP